MRLLCSVAGKTRNWLLHRRLVTGGATFNGTEDQPVLDGWNSWNNELERSMRVFPEFINENEEESLMSEIQPYMRRLQYEYDHWDNAIHGYRETEKRHWNDENKRIIDRVRQKAFPNDVRHLPSVHVLDLADNGWIKPHVDSVKFCGDVIAGLSLLSDSVMRLTLVGREQECRKDFLLPRRSLYIMSGPARYKYNHEILKNEESYHGDRHVPKTRRVAVICRCEPDKSSE